MGERKDAATGKYAVLAEGLESRAELLGGQNFGFEVDSAERVDLSRRMMEWNGLPENQSSRGRKCEKDCLHASLSWEKGLEPSREEMLEASQSFLKALGMESAQAVFVAHNDTEHRHVHIVASRIDPLTGKTFSQEDDFAKGQAWGIRWEREHDQMPKSPSRQALHRIVAAIEARDGRAVVGQLTERLPTFTARELDKALCYGSLGKEERAAFRTSILADPSVIGLRESAESAVSRYTTRDILAAEMDLLRGARRLADERGHGLSETRLDETAAAFTLQPEQAAALRHLAGSEGFSMLWGEAGTGKSHTLNAVRAAYEAEGREVVGLSWTNDIVEQMRGDGFANASTIASELHRLGDGRSTWDRRTVLIVDEAAMISTQHLGRLAAAAGAAGTKLILAGDDAQLASIERGGMFETLRQSHGAAVLSDVQRVKGSNQKAAFNRMHEGAFHEALAAFDKAGGVHWSDRQASVPGAMAGRYADDVAADPDKRRFMFAFSNDEVATLNAELRKVHAKRGELGAGLPLETRHGDAIFAAGDRIQFTGNGYGKRAKLAGLTNGRVGTVTAMDTSGEKPRLTVALDTGRGKPRREVSFVVGSDGRAGEFDTFRHGYAGTIYRGQGKTLDETYVAHSPQWRSSSSYVALTRHRDNVHVFAARETVADLGALAESMARPDNRRAATAYQIDGASALRLDFSDVMKAVAVPGSDPATSLRGLDRAAAFREAARHNERGSGPSSPRGKQAVADDLRRASRDITQSAPPSAETGPPPLPTGKRAIEEDLRRAGDSATQSAPSRGPGAAMPPTVKPPGRDR